MLGFGCFALLLDRAHQFFCILCFGRCREFVLNPLGESERLLFVAHGIGCQSRFTQVHRGRQVVVRNLGCLLEQFDRCGIIALLDGDIADPVRFLVVSFTSDWRFSTEHSRRIVRHLEGARLPTSFRDVASTWGHDSFLLDDAQYHAVLRAYIDNIEI